MYAAAATTPDFNYLRCGFLTDRSNQATITADLPTTPLESFDVSRFSILSDYVMPIHGAVHASHDNPGIIKVQKNFKVMRSLLFNSAGTLENKNFMPIFVMGWRGPTVGLKYISNVQITYTDV